MAKAEWQKAAEYWLWKIWQAGITGPGADISFIGGAPLSLGQKTMADSIPVVLASDQSAIPVIGTITGTPDVNIAEYGGAVTSLGQKAMTASEPVVIANDQSTIPTILKDQSNNALDFIQSALSNTAITPFSIPSYALLADASGNAYPMPAHYEIEVTASHIFTSPGAEYFAFANVAHIGLVLAVVVDAIDPGVSFDVVIQGVVDPLGTPQTYTIIQSVSIVATGTYILRVYPSLVAVANQAVADVLPSSWRAFFTFAGAGNVQYSARAILLR